MTIILTLENGQSTTCNVAPSFTQAMINECFIGKDYAGYGIVVKATVSSVTVY